MNLDNLLKDLNFFERFEAVKKLLSDREKAVLNCRYSLNNQPFLTYKAIGKNFCISGSRVRDVHNYAIIKLRRALYTPTERREFSELSVRAINCLRNAKIKTISQLVLYSREELMSFKNFGKFSLREVEDFLAQRGCFLKREGRFCNGCKEILKRNF